MPRDSELSGLQQKMIDDIVKEVKTGLKIRCSFCKFPWTEYCILSILEEHVRIWHIEYLPYECTVCHSEFAGKLMFYAHFQTKHPQSGKPEFILGHNTYKEKLGRLICLLMLKANDKTRTELTTLGKSLEKLSVPDGSVCPLLSESEAMLAVNAYCNNVPTVCLRCLSYSKDWKQAPVFDTLDERCKHVCKTHKVGKYKLAKFFPNAQ